MPIHDWTKVDAGLFHDFHQSWTVGLRDALNSSVLPSDYFALVEQNISGPIPDVLALKLAGNKDGVARGDSSSVQPSDGVAAVVVAEQPPRTCLTQRSVAAAYVRKANQVRVRHRHGDVVAVIEIISPGNKSSQSEFQALIRKSCELIRQGIHLLVVDLFPPGKRDPQGIHAAIWSEFEDDPLVRPANKPLTVASYDSGAEYVAYVEFVAVNDSLPEMPLFLRPEVYVPAPLESTYQRSWSAFPGALKGLLES